MSHPLFWPSKTFFYPIGNTAAVSLTQDLSPEQSADILLLGSGDPRNILFTLYADVNLPDRPRKLDITCCDIEPAILARNILLFVLLERSEPMGSIWNIFYHFMIDELSLSMLARHSKQLYEASGSIESWRDSSYAEFLKFVDVRTMLEVRGHWKSYAEFPNLASDRLNNLRDQQRTLSKSVGDNYAHNITPSRAAGPLWTRAATPVSKLFNRYWESGTLFTRTGDIKAAKNLNPTFIYAAPGEIFNPHYGTFPQGFHLTPAIVPFGSDKSPSTQIESAVLNLMKEQFQAWAGAFRASRAAKALTIRFYAGDALAFCRALDVFAATGSPATGVFVSAWRAAQVNFDGQGAGDSAAPKTFDVIDTSNLTDHLGLLNILIATRPLLKESPPSQSVLYTETLLPAGEDATKSLLDRICATVPTISVVLGLAPRAYVSSFNTQSNTHELVSHEQNNQYHERVAWVDPSSGDHDARERQTVPSFDADTLARVLFGFHQKMFTNQNVMAALLSRPSVAKLASLSQVHYHPETLVLLIQWMKRRVTLKNGDWEMVCDLLLRFIEKQGTQMFEGIYYQDLCLQLSRYQIYTVDPLERNWRAEFAANPSSGIFEDWGNVPPMLCVVVTVPRKCFQPFFDDIDATGTPTLEAHLTAKTLHSNAYTSLHAIWGGCITKPNSDKMSLEEDVEGIKGKSDLVVSFWASSRVLEFKNTSIALAIKSTPHSASTFATKLGMELVIFSAMVNDQSHVKLLTYQPSLFPEAPLKAESSACFKYSISANKPISIKAVTGSGQSSCDIASFTAHVKIDGPAEQLALSEKAEVMATQTSPCTTRMSIGKYHHKISFPYPILGHDYKLRIARKSCYVEVIVPVSEPLDAGGYHIDYAPIIRGSAYTPWNVHHVAVEQLPKIELNNPRKLGWLDWHTALQLSDRERDVRHGDKIRKVASINVLLNVKDTIHALVMAFSGVQGTKTRAVGLCDPDDAGVYAILFLGALRLDLASFTVIIDAALVPLSTERMPTLGPHIAKAENAKPMIKIATKSHEIIAWKKLLPAFIERCRTWAHKPNCEYTAQGRIPLTIQVDENPICSCGQGVGFEGPEWDVPLWKGFLPFATRVAISPLFAVSYIETVAGIAQKRLADQFNSTGAGNLQEQLGESCWVCGSFGKPGLLKCSRCKKAKYCSPLCQKEHWPEHKRGCIAG